MHLITADELTLSAFTEMLDDYAVAGTPFLGMTSPSDFSYFVRTCIKHSAGIGLGINVSPYTRYFLVDDLGKIYAQGDVRHKATKFTVTFQGQIGYGVLPSKRKCGYGTLMCKLLLEKARKMGFKNLIITCREDNEGSRKIIEANGGRYLNSVFNKKDDTYLRRYQVDFY